MIWLVLVSEKGGYYVHSAHTDEKVAREWAACKEHDGMDTAIAKCGADAIESIQKVMPDYVSST